MNIRKKIAKECRNIGAAHNHIRKIAKPGMVLIFEDLFVPILKIKDKSKSGCRYMLRKNSWGGEFHIFYANWNQYESLTNNPDRYEDWLNANCVSMRDAVINYKFRNTGPIEFVGDIKKEYDLAITEVTEDKLNKMSKKQLVEALKGKI